jgi:hypothetical protein
MNLRELVDHIRSGPAKLVLDKALPRFRRRTRSNPCDFNEFLEALQSSETIRTVECGHHQQLGVTEDEWVLLVKTLGNIKDIQRLQFFCTAADSRDSDPFQAVANAVSNAQSLCELKVVPVFQSLPRDLSGLIALANALREHTTLKGFSWVDCWRSRVDPGLVLQALPACPHLQRVVIRTKYASADAMNNLLQLTPAAKLYLSLKMNQWLALADEIRQGRCKIKYLSLSMHDGSTSGAAEAVKVVADAIRRDCSLEHITFKYVNGFLDEAGVMALADALTVNKTLRVLTLSYITLGAKAYEAFAAMLRVNTSLVLEIPQVPLFRMAVAGDEILLEFRKQMLIEQRLNNVGRGKRLVSRQTTKEEWVDALHTLNFTEFDDSPPIGPYNMNDSPAFRVSCLYSLLRLNPSELFACPR